MNLPTIIILSLVVIAFVLIIYREVKNKKNGNALVGAAIAH
jgi:hypothetical protein